MTPPGRINKVYIYIYFFLFVHFFICLCIYLYIYIHNYICIDISCCKLLFGPIVEVPQSRISNQQPTPAVNHWVKNWFGVHIISMFINWTWHWLTNLSWLILKLDFCTNPSSSLKFSFHPMKSFWNPIKPHLYKALETHIPSGKLT